MTPAEFDFRKPPPGELERHVKAWLTVACRRATDICAQTFPFPATVELSAVESLSAKACFAALPEGTIASVLLAQKSPEGGAALLLPNPLLLALVAGLVGETPTETPADRERTELESSLVPHLLKEVIVQPLIRSWPTETPPPLAAGNVVSPRAAWVPSGELALRATFTFTTPFGQFQLYLLLTRNGNWEQLAQANMQINAVATVNRQHIESLVCEMEVEMSVVLGRVDLSMYDLTGLSAGDVLVFDQKVDEPLEGLVAGTQKFRVWPGVIGDRAAVVVDTITGE